MKYKVKYIKHSSMELMEKLVEFEVDEINKEVGKQLISIQYCGCKEQLHTTMILSSVNTNVFE